MNSKKKRLIAIVLFKKGNVVQSKFFKEHKVVGDPYVIIDRLSAWNADEVIYLNIRPDQENFTRSDKKNSENISFDQVIQEMSKRAFMPLTVGGGIKNINDVEKYFKMGADKISINSQIYHNPTLLKDSAKIYGRQSIVASVDFKYNLKAKIYEIFVDGGKTLVSKDIQSYLKQIEDLGAGEILVNSLDRDGSRLGYDYNLHKIIKQNINLPIIVTGGVGSWSDFYAGDKAGLDALAASNIFHFFENSYVQAIKYLTDKGCNFRPPVHSKLTRSEI